MAEEKRELTKKELKEKLYNERKTFRRNIKMRDEQVKKINDQADDAVHELKTAFHNLVSTICRTYGIEMENGDYELHIPVPESGWITAAKKIGGEYVLIAKKIS